MFKSILPIDSNLNKINEMINRCRVLILTAEPGAGKTTRVPAYLTKSFKKILVLQPRRIATRHAAERVSEEQSWKVGDEVGILTRFDHLIGSETKLVFATEGLLPRLVKEDPNLSAFDLVIMDEFHERHVHTDYNLALVDWMMRSSRSDLKLIIMSATLERSQLDQYFQCKCEWLSVKGRQYPVNVSYRPEYTPSSPDSIVKAILLMLKDEHILGDILVFLAGSYEIEKTASKLKSQLDSSGFDVLPLYAKLSLKEQRRVFEKSHKRRIILSTNVAETSVTIESVVAVIDTGLGKHASFARWSGLNTLKTGKISQFSCVQRAGRAGRVRSGVCWRLFSEDDFLRREKSETPEISRVDLSDLLLNAKSLISKDIDVQNDLRWLDRIPEKHLQLSLDFLRQVGALNRNLELTKLGDYLAMTKLHPRYGLILYRASQMSLASCAALLIAILSEDMLFTSDFRSVSVSDCDLIYQAEVFLKDLHRKDQEFVQIDRFIDRRKISRIKQVYRQLQKRMSLEPLDDLVFQKSHHQKLKECLLAGFYDRVAKFRPAAKQRKGAHRQFYHFCQGGGGILAESSTLKKAEYIIILDAHENLNQSNAAQRIQIRHASALPLALLHSVKSMISVKTEVKEVQGDMFAFESINYGKLLLSESQKRIDRDKKSIWFTKLIREKWPFPFDSAKDLDLYHEKIDILNAFGYEHEFPRFVGEMFDLLLEGICLDASSIEDIKNCDLNTWIMKQLDEGQVNWLKFLFPDEIKIDDNKALPIKWINGKFSIEAKLQRFFTVKSHPSILEGKLPLNVILLAPNGRPAQVTDDLMGFWNGSYKLVKKELQRRYPKHDWPDFSPPD